MFDINLKIVGDNKQHKNYTKAKFTNIEADIGFDIGIDMVNILKITINR